MTKTIGIVTSLLLTFVPMYVFAGTVELDTVSIDGISVPSCGEQSLAFTGSGTYSEGTQHLVVDLDGTEIMYSADEPATWATESTSASVGSHTLTATIYDKSDRETVMAQDTAQFTVNACGSSEDGDTSGGEGEGDEQDCCPGQDPITTVSTTTSGKVKGAKASGLPASLRPLNSIFRTVYGRTPTFQEWLYWANRLLSDKPQYDALYGAMQWHHLRGHTTGK